MSTRRPEARRVRGWELTAGVIAGLLAGFLLAGGGGKRAGETPPERPSVAAPAPIALPEVVRLERQLELEQQRRGELESQLAGRPAVPAPPLEKVGTPARQLGNSPPPLAWIAEDVLLGAGFAAAELEALNGFYEKTELERLFVRDQATREGWFRRPRYARRMREFNERYEALRFDYGDDGYDWILYARGRDNRVRVDRVLQGSAAADIGLEEGDVILQYDDERIFAAPALQQATGEGRAGATVSLEADRRGERIRLYPPRGPLGVVLSSLSVEPRARY